VAFRRRHFKIDKFLNLQLEKKFIEKKEKVELLDDSIIINNLSVEDLNTYKIIKDIKEENREDFIKKAIIIGAIGLRNLYLTENVDYIEKEFKEILKGLENQSKDIKNNLSKTLKNP